MVSKNIFRWLWWNSLSDNIGAGNGLFLSHQAISSAYVDHVRVPFHNRDVTLAHDDVIKWKQFPRYWPFVLGIHRSPVNFTHISQWRGALMYSLIRAWANNGDDGDLRCYRAHDDVIVMVINVVLLFVVVLFAIIYICIYVNVDFDGEMLSSLFVILFFVAS